ncbi:polymer-forming cytoskeletal protein [Brevibacillus borstelensis]|uniref:polymer-forming cytoskeletal protein n=1 Tax=Brevibacillus borstelensis TaxID=45462 RepID=UPI0030C3FD51
MENQQRSNININGSGTASGGSFGEVKINGSGTITSDLDCNAFSCNGTSDVRGNTKAERIKVNGTASFLGNVHADNVKVYGTCDIEGNLTCREVLVSGSFGISGTVSGESIEIQGSVSIGHDCEAEYFRGRGGFSVEGLLNAGTIDIELYGKARAREIGGEKITVKQGRMFGISKLISSFFSGAHELHAGTIEGDEIKLEFTRAKVVRGKNVVIGEGCEIEEVEYTNDFKILQDAKVRSYRKI